MDKNHEGECSDIDPFIPTGICSVCCGVPKDTVLPEDRPSN